MALSLNNPIKLSLDSRLVVSDYTRTTVQLKLTLKEFPSISLSKYCVETRGSYTFYCLKENLWFDHRTSFLKLVSKKNGAVLAVSKKPDNRVSLTFEGSFAKIRITKESEEPETVQVIPYVPLAERGTLDGWCVGA